MQPSANPLSERYRTYRRRLVARGRHQFIADLQQETAAAARAGAYVFRWSASVRRAEMNLLSPSFGGNWLGCSAGLSKIRRVSTPRRKTKMYLKRLLIASVLPCGVAMPALAADTGVPVPLNAGTMCSKFSVNGHVYAMQSGAPGTSDMWAFVIHSAETGQAVSVATSGDNTYLGTTTNTTCNGGAQWPTAQVVRVPNSP